MKIMNINLIKNIEYAELLSQPENSKLSKLILKKLKSLPDYEVKQNNFFIECISTKNIMKEQGWKIHISASNNNYIHILKELIRIIVPMNVSFKWVSIKNRNIMLTKDFLREQAGKFITIYPQNNIQFQVLCRIFQKKLRQYSGVPILTDKSIGNVISIRYGGFKKILDYDNEGDGIYCIRDTNKKLVYDRREIGIYKPEWITENFVKPLNNLYPKQKSKLLEQYNFKNALQFTNYGGVYEAIQKKDNLHVVIKEAKKYFGGNIFNNSFPKDVRSIRRNEYLILQKISLINATPKPISYFKEKSGDYLVEKYVSGDLLRTLRLENPLYYPNATEDEYNQYLKKLSHIFLDLYFKINKINKNGIILNDLTPNNIIVDLKTNSAKIIDLESSVDLSCEKPTYSLFVTPGYSEYFYSKKLSTNDDFSWVMCLIDMLIARAQLLNINIKLIIQSLEFCREIQDSWAQLCTHLILYLEHYKNNSKTQNCIKEILSDLNKEIQIYG